jgi:uncharacterized membrane protein
MVDLNKAMYRVLMGGMILSSATYAVGIFLFFFRDQNSLQTSIVHYQSLVGFVTELLALRSPAVLTLATMFVIATPITRVLISIVVFASNRNFKYVAVTVVVFLILISSVLLGYLGHFTPQ